MKWDWHLVLLSIAVLVTFIYNIISSSKHWQTEVVVLNLSYKQNDTYSHDRVTFGNEKLEYFWFDGDYNCAATPQDSIWKGSARDYDAQQSKATVTNGQLRFSKLVVCLLVWLILRMFYVKQQIGRFFDADSGAERNSSELKNSPAIISDTLQENQQNRFHFKHIRTY